MRRLPSLVAGLVRLLVRDRAARDGLLGDLEERYGELRDAGRLRRAAWLTAEVSAAAVHYSLERWGLRASRREERTGLMDALWQDLKFTLRSLEARPAFSVLVVATLGLGIGANTAIFSLVNGLLFEPLPYEAGERLVIINQRTPEGFTASVALPNYRDWKERARSFDGFSAILPSNATLSRPDGARVVEAAWVHGGFFETLGTDAMLGRTFTEAESEPGADALVVLGHALWAGELGADPEVVGRTVLLGDQPWTVGGVMPPDFQPYGDVQLYRPMGYVVDRIPWDDRGTGAGTVVLARLAPGVDAAEAQTELEAVAAQIQAEVGGEVGVGNLTELRAWYLGDVDRQVLLLQIAVAFVLLVACANVANLLMVRSEGRKGEIAVRAALGAARSRVYRQLLTESLVYGVAGGVVGAALGFAGLEALLRAAGGTLPPSFLDRVDVDASVLLFTAGVALATAVLAGFVPALRSARTELADALRDSARTVRTGGKARSTLVAAEVGLSMVLLVGAGLLIRSLSNLQDVDKGFDGTGVLTLRVLAGADLDTREAWATYHAGLRERIRALPGVSGAATSQIFPLSGNSWEMLYRDEQTPPGERGESVLLTMVSPEYFDVYDIEILEGRGFTEADRWGDQNVAIVDETLAAARWPNQSALGERVTFEQMRTPDGRMVDVWRTVVGVAGHVRHYELTSPSRIEVYTPLVQYAQWGFTCFVSVKASTAVAPLVPAVRTALRELDPGAALYRVRTMEGLIDEQLGGHRALRELFAVFAALTLLLGAIGIYSVVSHATALRVREMGVRIALGGVPGRLARLMVAESLAPVAVGLVAGAAASVALGRLLGAFLYEVEPAEPVVLAAAAALLLAVAVVSAWLPARGAARVEPTAALRME